MPSRLALRLAAAAILVVPAFAARPVDSAVADEARRHLDARVFQLGLDRNASFATKNVFEEATGEAHVRMNQFYKGVRVFEGEAIVHLRGGAVTGRTEALVRGLNLNVTPTLGATEALAVAHQSLAPQGAYAHTPTTELVVATVGQPVLAYHIHTELENGAAETRHTDFLVDAHSGAILEQWSTLHTTAASGTGNSQYSGVVTLNTNSLASGYELRDTVRGMNFDTRDLNHATTGNGTTYTDADNTWGDGANYVSGAVTTSANGQTAAVDAHYGVGLTYDYYKNIFGRNGIDGIGTATYSRVHYSSAYDNAFWSDSCFCMTYGDGSSFKSLESIDVAGHEMSHGVCARTANLTYRGESGGLNEANSDIMGTMVEFMAHGGGTTTVPNYSNIASTINVYWTGTTTPTPSTSKAVPAANYLIGEQLATSKFTHPLRFMYKPSLDGSSPDAWSKTLGRLDVHYSSGVANHFYFLLSHGSQIDSFSDGIQSPMANGVTSVAGLGNDKAARIWFRALTVYMTSSTNYAGARTATLSAATDLYGAGSAEYNSVNTAWLAVNVK
ncbi:M4 family metallopeptidase [Geothrix oryzisoli]|uniref:M4 family metallopeptidase n=1 Tax=Geothrix oryzisoli TaxID=2922721 RepID=UPI001FAE4D89|nr:M4 family metallopeptidase [Geothrix oryzisoli]